MSRYTDLRRRIRQADEAHAELRRYVDKHGEPLRRLIRAHIDSDPARVGERPEEREQISRVITGVWFDWMVRNANEISAALEPFRTDWPESGEG